jgi:UDP-N-acetylglucosamine/UDP-N-acetylgalactosamine 4-epimerase|tara:strand:- start:574 stop:1560 length:987 start_codon:yes stop_codon:yes gene_type:complete
MYYKSLKNKNVLITGGAGFIGSNLCESLLEIGANVVCLDNFSTGHKRNIKQFLNHKNFKLIEGDIRNLNTCHKACNEIEYVLHQAALGSVPRSIKDPISSNDVNISGFLNMLIASRDNKIQRFVFAASSSTYGDSKDLPKVENKIGKPLSNYAVTKYVNELYADVFNKSYNLNYIGLRYFNVFGKRQDPDGNYAAVIPLFVKKLMNLESPIINGDGSFSRDFTYIDNVVQINLLALTTNREKALNQIYNTAFGEKTNLIELVNYLKKYLSYFNQDISKINFKNKEEREGDIPHSLASIEKAKKLLGYNPTHSLEMGVKETVNWYWNNL